MVYRGIVQQGVIILQGGAALPDGTEVSVVPAIAPRADEEGAQGTAPIEEQARAEGTPTIWTKLAQLGRAMESLPCDLPEDLAEYHDHYLYGTTKRR